MPSLCRLLLVGLLLGLTTACSPEKSKPLRIGINAWPGYEFLYLAQEKGFYREAGVEVRLIEFFSLADNRRAYERGQIDVMGSTVVEVLQARDQSARQPQIVQVVDYSDGADVILARPGVDSGAKLRGARIGVELASLGVYILARGLEKNGLTLGDVTVVSMDQTSMVEAFRKGELDAVVTYPPVSVEMLRQPGSKVVFTTREISGEVVDVIAVEAEVCVTRREDVARMLRAFHRAVEYAGKEPAEAHAYMAKREGISTAEFTAALTDGIKMIPETEQAAYFAPGGKLSLVINTSDRILRETKQLNGPDRRAGILNSDFIAP